MPEPIASFVCGKVYLGSLGPDLDVFAVLKYDQTRWLRFVGDGSVGELAIDDDSLAGSVVQTAAKLALDRMVAGVPALQVPLPEGS